MNPNQSIDSSNMHKSIYDFPGQMSEAISIGKKIKLINDHSFISNIVICGMGGSAIGGDLAKSLINDSLKVPIIISRDYSVPNWVNDKSLVICSSYSGNTEETLSGLNDAIKNNLEWAVISSGGKLIDLAIEHNKEYIKIPDGLQPRAAFGYLTQAVSKIVDIVEGRSLQLPIYLAVTKVLLEKKGFGNYKGVAGIYYILDEEGKTQLGCGNQEFRDIAFDLPRVTDQLIPNRQYKDIHNLDELIGISTNYVTSYAQKITNGEFPTTHHEKKDFCQHCSFKRVCRIGAIEV